MHSASLSQLGGRAVCCTSLPLDSVQDGLRCQFGDRDVPAQAGGDGTVRCVPPPEVLQSAQPVTCKVLAADDTILCEVLLDQETRTDSMWPASGKGMDPGTASAAALATAAAPAVVAASAEDGDFGRRAGETRGDYLRREYSNLKPFVIISLSYLLYTTTDGAIRMIVLLHAYNLGFTAWEVAIMFSLYELAGVVTNLLAGLAGARWGIKNTLLTGLVLQIGGIGMLYGFTSDWAESHAKWQAILYVTVAQMLCGIAKDLTKLGGKTVTKLVTPDEKQSRLFKIVSFITGFKNSMKGVGYFIGAACITFNYYFALSVLIAFILAAMPWAVVGLSNQLGRARKENVSLAKIFRQRYNVNVLSLARFFLFMSRDMWFEVPLPFFLRDAVYGLGWQRVVVGAFLAGWIICYGQIQSWTPQLVLQPLRQSPANKYVELLWNGILVACPAVMAVLLLGSNVFDAREYGGMVAVVLVILLAFCAIFAVNSSVHSYLIVRYAEGETVALTVGIYYMANALGRLTGTLVSGALYTYAGGNTLVGFGYCFIASTAAAFASAVVTAFIHDDVGGLMCGPRLTLVPAPAPVADVEAGSQELASPEPGTTVKAPAEQAMIGQH